MDKIFYPKRSTESTVATIQKQAISTKYIKKHVFNVEDDDTCRICRVQKETIHHISGYNGLSPTKYLQRHDNIYKYIHVLLLLEHRYIEKYIPWYQQQSAKVVGNNSTKILWNFPIQTDHDIINNKPNITVVDKINKTVNLRSLSQMTTITAINVSKKYEHIQLSCEIKTLWNLNKVQITPIIVGNMGTLYNKFDDDISKLSLTNHKFRAEGAQKIVWLGTAQIVRSFLQIVIV